MTLIWLAFWFAFGRPNPQMFITNWDIWGITLTLVVVTDAALVTDWWTQHRHRMASAGRVKRVSRFVQHFVEMGIAMVLGMFALIPVSTALHLDAPEPYILVMAVFMSVPMVAWMRFRGHDWERSGEMAAAMLVPIILVLGLRFAGLLSPRGLLGLGHKAMWICMLGLMLWRWTDYSQHGHGPVMQPPAGKPATEVIQAVR